MDVALASAVVMDMRALPLFGDRSGVLKGGVGLSDRDVATASWPGARLESWGCPTCSAARGHRDKNGMRSGLTAAATAITGPGRGSTEQSPLLAPAAAAVAHG